VGRFPIWLSGAQRDILDSCRTDRPKYVGIGMAVLITSAMAAVSMAFALHIALKATLPAAVPFALAWGLAIMSLDRWLVVSMVRQAKRLNYLMLALPRVALGLLFGVIISTPLTLQIFHLEIANQISIDHTNAANAYNAALSKSALAAQVNTDQKAVSAAQAVINSGGGTGTSPAQDPVLVSLQQQLRSDQNMAQAFYNSWHCEEYGFPGHCVVGNGPAAKTDLQNYQLYHGQVQSDQSQIESEETALNARNKENAIQAVTTARINLVTDQAKLSQDQGNLAKLKQSFNATNADDTGILASLQALAQLRSSSPTLFMAEFLLFLFFTAIECLPILVKVLLNLGPMNMYERAIAQAEQASLLRAGEEITTQHLATVRRQDELNEESERLHHEWLTRVLPELIKDEIDARERVARARLARWEQQAQAEHGSDQGDDRFGPGGLSATGRPAPDWTNVRPRTRVRLRLVAAWQAFWRAGTTTMPTRPAPGAYWQRP
jgi:Domain of unknown function (DUF4407)